MDTMISFSHTDKPRAMHEHDVLEVLKHVVGGSGLGRGLRARGRMGCRVWAEVLAWSGLTRGCGLGVMGWSAAGLGWSGPGLEPWTVG